MIETATGSVERLATIPAEILILLIILMIVFCIGFIILVLRMFQSGRNTETTANANALNTLAGILERSEKAAAQRTEMYNKQTEQIGTIATSLNQLTGIFLQLSPKVEEDKLRDEATAAVIAKIEEVHVDVKEIAAAVIPSPDKKGSGDVS